MFIEVTVESTGSKVIVPRLSTYVTREVNPDGSIEVSVGVAGDKLYFNVRESYEDIRELLGLVRTVEVNNGN